MNDDERQTIHHSQLPEAPPGDVLHLEWRTYRLEVARLLAEGYESKFVLIKGQQIVGLHDSWTAAREAGLRLYLRQPFLVHCVCTDEPVLRVRGFSLPCHS